MCASHINQVPDMDYTPKRHYRQIVCNVSDRYPIPEQYIVQKRRQDKKQINILKIVDDLTKRESKFLKFQLGNMKVQTRRTTSTLTYDDEMSFFPKEPHIHPQTRVLFIPSNGRAGQQCLWDLVDAAIEASCVIVILVNQNQMKKYVDIMSEKKYHSNVLVVGSRTDEEVIGAARASAQELAKCWGLKKMWMIDDNVNVRSLMIRETRATLKQVMIHLEIIMNTNDLALLGAHQNDKATTEYKKTLRINDRAPYSFVLLNISLCNKCTYNKKLPYLEDIIFAWTISLEKTVAIADWVTFHKYTKCPGGIALPRQKRMTDFWHNK